MAIAAAGRKDATTRPSLLQIGAACGKRTHRKYWPTAYVAAKKSTFWGKPMHIVEVRRRNAELADAMAQMRTWLDNHAIEPVLFEIGFLPGREMRFCVQFRNERD